MISTHALREEGDQFAVPPQGSLFDFYPRPPRGGRLGKGNTAIQSVKISTHALREEGDRRNYNSPAETAGFLPTPSARRATSLAVALVYVDV